VYVTGDAGSARRRRTVPQVAPLQPAPESAQVTPAFALSFATVAVNACVSPTVTLAVVSESVNAQRRRARVTVTVAVPFFVPSAIEVAVTVTVATRHARRRGVSHRRPRRAACHRSAPHGRRVQPAPDTPQVTPLLVLSLATVAVNACVSPACTDAVPGATVTPITGSGAGVELDPPHPVPIATLTNANANNVNANNDLAARTKGTRVKAVSVFFVLVFRDQLASAGLEAIPK